MSEHPQQTDRVLRDTRILTLRIWAVVGCIVIAAVIFNLMGILAPVIEFLAVGSIIAFVMSPITNWLEHQIIFRRLLPWHRSMCLRSLPSLVAVYSRSLPIRPRSCS